MALRLNLGAGDTKIPGYTSVDLYDEKADVQADIAELPFEDDSVEHIVAYQVIEHVPYNKSQAVFDEIYRVLMPGARATMETPDIDYVCSAILAEGLTDKWIYNLVGQYYRPWDKDRYSDWEMNAASIHRNPWNLERIKEFAQKAGLKVEVNDVKHPQYDYPENLSVDLIK